MCFPVHLKDKPYSRELKFSCPLKTMKFSGFPGCDVIYFYKNCGITPGFGFSAWSLTLPQGNPDDDKNDDGAKASATEFLCAITCDQGSENVVHILLKFGVSADISWIFLPCSDCVRSMMGSYFSYKTLCHFCAHQPGTIISDNRYFSGKLS